MATRSGSDRARRDELLRELDAAYAGPAWHGPSLRAALRNVAADEAIWRPAPGRNCIWELALHAAYTKHRVLHRLAPDAAGKFPRKLARAWWPAADGSAGEAAWRRDLALLDESHRRLAEGVAAASDAELRGRRGNARFTLWRQVLGIALHDVYHAGQIRLVRVLYADRARRA